MVSVFSSLAASSSLNPTVLQCSESGFTSNLGKKGTHV